MMMVMKKYQSPFHHFSIGAMGLFCQAADKLQFVAQLKQRANRISTGAGDGQLFVPNGRGIH